MLPRRLPKLADECDPVLAVDGDDRHRARMLDDLPLVVAPALERDGEQLALPGCVRLVRLHPSSLRALTPAA